MLSKGRVFCSLVLCSVVSMAVAEARGDQQWLTADIEFDGERVLIGQPYGYSLEQGLSGSLQLLAQDEAPAASHDLFLSRQHLLDVDWSKIAGSDRAKYVETQSPTAISVLVPALNDVSNLKVKLNYRIVDLAGLPIESHQLLFKAATAVNGTGGKQMFTGNAQCIILSTRQYSEPVFKVDLSRRLPFESLDQYERKQRATTKNLQSVERGAWAGYDWVKITAIGYGGSPYSVGALRQGDGPVYLASYEPDTSTTPPLQDCAAYNSAAMADVQRLVRRLNR